MVQVEVQLSGSSREKLTRRSLWQLQLSITGALWKYNIMKKSDVFCLGQVQTANSKQRWLPTYERMTHPTGRMKRGAA